MIQYQCEKCGMGVKGMTCVKCNVYLCHETITVDDTIVAVSKCPTCNGKIKSPQCCGIDMTCPVVEKPK